MKYDFNLIEKRWQKKWEQKKVFSVKENSKKSRSGSYPKGTRTSARPKALNAGRKFYCLEMFPYPSGSGLHMGHALNYTIGDIYARFKRMNGFNVLYPMGYDSFGLPAENAAIKSKTHPKIYTEKSIKNFINQQKSLGLSYDWTRMIQTHKPEYYRWNQFWFLKFLEKGLVYRKKAPVNWCPKCETVLANEQVHSGKCWRHEDTGVETKYLEQWFTKTTDYSDELLEKIDSLEWPERIKTMQRNWIGKSEGTEIDFGIENPEEKISNVVIVHGCPSDKEKFVNPEKRTYDKHWMPWLKSKLKQERIKCETPLMPEPWAPNYGLWKKEFEKIKIDEDSILIGHSCGCAFLVRWLGETKKKIKKLILVAPWKIAYREDGSDKDFYDYKISDAVKFRVGNVIIFTSDNEENDGKKSAKIFHDSLVGEIIELKNHGHFTEGDMGTKEFPELLNEILADKKWPIFTTRPDTIFGVTFMVVSAQHPRLFEMVTKEQKKEVEKFLKKLKSVSAKELGETEKEGVFTGSYAVNPVTKEKVPVWAGNFVVADYGSGMVMAVPGHDQRDFEFAKKYGLKIKEVISGGNIRESAYTGAGKLINSREFNGLDSDEAKEHISVYLKEKKLGRKTINYKLKDWLISRQRYWGTPIPVVYCDACGIVPVPEKELPVLLPEKIKFGKGNPLATSKNFVETRCPKCRRKARRETDTMDTFFDSSWYYLRYCDSANSKKPFDKEIVNYWMPVDQYIGGAEHACMHLIYARFFTKALRDLGFVKFNEPFTKLFNQGMLHASDGNKMSKSLGNVINPLDVVKKYGADSLRLALMSFASPDSDINWDEKVLFGSFKFVNKVFENFQRIKIGKSSPRTENKLNKAIKEVTNQIENFKYNLAIIKIRDLFNSFGEEESADVLKNCLKLLHPFCPHITEELWTRIGGKDFICLEKWPIVDEKKIDEKIEKQEEAVEKLKEDINHLIRLTGKKNPKIFVYVLPNELGIYSEVSDVKIFSVSDKTKYDPGNKSKKVKPGRPGIYLE